MTHNTRNTLMLAALLAAPLIGSHQVAEAQSTPVAELQSSTPVIDVEVDPLAYALNGYSLHAGITWDRFRLDLGAFALDMPEALHGVEGLEVYGSGFGAKLDYQFVESLDGLFVGAMLSRSRETIKDIDTHLSTSDSHTTVGARVGYRIKISRGFYALPWIGIDLSLSDRKQRVGTVDYDPGRTIFFPTIHLGKKF